MLGAVSGCLFLLRPDSRAIFLMESPRFQAIMISNFSI